MVGKNSRAFINKFFIGITAYGEIHLLSPIFAAVNHFVDQFRARGVRSFELYACNFN